MKIAHQIITISDMHLGAHNCRRKSLKRLFRKMMAGKIKCDKLIINGDSFNSLKMKKLRERDWKVIRLVRDLAQKIEVVLLLGNHDEDQQFVEMIFGPYVTVCVNLVFENGKRQFYAAHGHAHDEFLNKHPLMTAAADLIYNVTQAMDPTHKLAKKLKKTSKRFVKCAEKIGLGLAMTAKQHQCQVALGGHTHHAGRFVFADVEVWNSGCWVERPCTYLAINDGQVTLHEFE